MSRKGLLQAWDCGKVLGDTRTPDNLRLIMSPTSAPLSVLFLKPTLRHESSSVLGEEQSSLRVVRAGARLVDTLSGH